MDKSNDTTPKDGDDVVEEELDLSEEDLHSDEKDDEKDDEKKPDGEDEEDDNDDDADALEEVLEKSVDDLTDEDKALIKKHGEHLSDANKDKFKTIIGGDTEEYSKERFDGLMSTMNKNKDEFNKKLEEMSETHKKEIEALKQPDDTKLTDEEKQAKSEKEAGKEFVEKVMKDDPVYKRMAKEQKTEENLQATIKESSEHFSELDKISNQDFKDGKVQKKYYDLASEYTKELGIFVNVLAAYKLEQQRDKVTSDTKHKINKDIKRKKDADLKPKQKGGGGKAPKEFDPSTGTADELWDSVEEDLAS